MANSLVVLHGVTLYTSSDRTHCAYSVSNPQAQNVEQKCTTLETRGATHVVDAFDRKAGIMREVLHSEVLNEVWNATTIAHRPNHTDFNCLLS